MAHRWRLRPLCSAAVTHRHLRLLWLAVCPPEVTLQRQDGDSPHWGRTSPPVTAQQLVPAELRQCQLVMLLNHSPLMLGLIGVVLEMNKEWAEIITFLETRRLRVWWEMCAPRAQAVGVCLMHGQANCGDNSTVIIASDLWWNTIAGHSAPVFPEQARWGCLQAAASWQWS